MSSVKRIAGSALVGLSLVLVGCAGIHADDVPKDDGSAVSQSGDADFDANATFVGQWRGSVEGASGQTPYGTSNAPEPMLDIYLNEDGTCSVEPLAAHRDLLAEEGTWSATDASAATLSLPSGEIVLTAVDDITLEADAFDFGIEGFDVMELALY